MSSSNSIPQENVGVALAIVFGAGAATAIGASVVFFPALVKLASRRVLAASLGLSAGVMTYVSFVEIFSKSVNAFEDAGHEESTAYIYSTLSFFGGVAVMKIVDVIVTLLSGGHHHHHHGDGIHDPHNLCRERTNSETEAQIPTPHCVGCSDDPVAELNDWHQRADREINAPLENTIASSENFNDNSSDGGSSSKDRSFEDHGEGINKSPLNRNGNGDVFDEKEESSNQGEVFQTSVSIENATGDKKSKDDPFGHLPGQDDHKQLVRMGLNTALAISIHNFPEGLATFVSALDDPSVGAVLGIAIGIHNIPEGLCVALPIYYATGNRWKAFLWGCLSGASEPIAALLGWAILANVMTQDVYAILFGIVSGMMVIISLKELIPTAHRYDAEDTVVTYSIIAGMAVIALSLVLFQV